MSCFWDDPAAFWDDPLCAWDGGGEVIPEVPIVLEPQPCVLPLVRVLHCTAPVEGTKPLRCTARVGGTRVRVGV